VRSIPVFFYRATFDSDTQEAYKVGWTLEGTIMIRLVATALFALGVILAIGSLSSTMTAGLEYMWNPADMNRWFYRLGLGSMFIGLVLWFWSFRQ